MYRDPLREQLRQSVINHIKLKETRQNRCDHLCGGNLRGYYTKYSAFCFLKLPTGEVIGTCLYCQKTISSIDPKDSELFKQHHLMKMGTQAESGQFLEQKEDVIFDQVKRFTPLDQDRILREHYKDLKKKVNVQETAEIQKQAAARQERDDAYNAERQRMLDMPMEDLKELAEAELRKLKNRYR